MKKRTFTGIIACIVSAVLIVSPLGGCSALRGRTDTGSPAAEDTEEVGDVKDNKKEDKKEKKKEKDRADRPDFLVMEYANRQMKLIDDDYDAAEGVCYSFTLDDATKEAYPEFAEKIEEINNDVFTEFNLGMESAAQGSIQRHLEGWGYPYEDDATATVTRADSLAFSYGVCHYSFLGGAHGYTYYTAETIDPVTCKDIKFNDVVVDTSDLPDICFEELLDQYSDMKDYFDSLNTDKENLLNRIREDADSSKDGPVWSLSYDGITMYFEDYSMGSYAAGSKEVFIPYEKHKEIFNDRYFEYKNGTPDIKDHVTATNDFKPVELEKKSSIIEVGYDFARDNSYSGPVYTTMLSDKLLIPDEYPKLKERFDKINRHNEDEAGKGFAAYTSDIVKEYTKVYGTDADDAPMYDYEYGIRQFVTRADSAAFSTVESHQEMHTQDMGKRKLIGINIDPETGDDIPLNEVVTDVSDLKRAVKKVLKKESYPEDTEADTLSELKKQIDSGDLVSREDLSWTVGYEGLTFYCNTLCNFSLGDMQDDAFMLFIPYSEYPDLFYKKYVNHPVAYAYQIPVTRGFTGGTYLDIDYNNEYVPVQLGTTLDEYGDFDRVRFSINSVWTSVGDLWASDLAATVVKDPLDFLYLYVEYSKNDGYPSLGIYSFDYTDKDVKSITDDEMPIYEINYPASYDGKHEGYVMTNPTAMKIRATDDAMGARNVYAKCCIDSSGYPRSRDGYWYYLSDPSMDLRAKQKTDTAKSCIPAGVTVSPYRINEPVSDDAGQSDPKKKTLELKSKDNRTFSLDIEYSGGTWKYKGTSLEDLFDGYFIFPG